MSRLAFEPVDRGLLDGDFGAAAARAMRMLQRYGEVLGADKFVSIHSAHIDGCLYHGPSSIDFVRRFVDLSGSVRVPTTLNVAAVDVVHPGWHQGDPAIIDAQRQLTALHEQLGCLATLTCAPYQRMIQPLPGEHVAWAESNAIVFANSVLGARTDRYGDFTDLCAALTGRVPYVGFHRPENRYATLLVEVPDREASGMPADLYFACLGYVLGKRAIGHVPVVVNLGSATRDDLKALGAAAASSGALALFHAVGLTPEADSLASATNGRDAVLPVVRITLRDLHDALEQLCPLEESEPIAAVCLGTPHFSIDEFARLAKLVDAQASSASVEVYVSTSREIEAEVRRRSDLACLFDFGVDIVVDTCTYLAPVVRESTGAIATNSGKWAHYGPGNLKRRVGLMTMERCVRSAVLGEVAPQ
jgi:predicted aconitase